MIDAWLSASEMMASFSSNSGSNTPPLASNAAAYKIVSSVPRKAEIACSSSLCTVCVPQMKRTDDRP